MYQEGVNQGKIFSTATGIRSGFETVGFPYPAGSKVDFEYHVYTGRTNGSGNEITIANPGAGSEFVIASNSALLHGWYLPAGAPGMTGCTNNHFLTEYTNPVGKPHYNWAILTASRDFKTGDTLCTVISRIIDTNDKGMVNTGRPLVLDHIGD